MRRNPEPEPGPSAHFSRPPGDKKQFLSLVFIVSSRNKRSESSISGVFAQLASHGGKRFFKRFPMVVLLPRSQLNSSGNVRSTLALQTACLGRMRVRRAPTTDPTVEVDPSYESSRQGECVEPSNARKSALLEKCVGTRALYRGS